MEDDCYLKQSIRGSELTTVDMFTFLHGLSSLREEGGMLVYLFHYFKVGESLS